MAQPAEAPAVPHRLAARRLLRAAGKATLATVLAEAEPAGWPYASLVTVATTQEGAVILLLSRLSDHTRNIAADSRVSLLIDGTAGWANPQQGPRVTLMGRAEPDGDPALRRRFLARHPGAALYAGFADFGFFRVVPEHVHLVGGFARAVWLRDRLTVEPVAAAALAAAEQDILAHMNADHPDAVAVMAQVLLGRPEGDWRMVAIDADGCDLAAGDEVARLEFAAPIDGPEAARQTLAELARRARSGAGPSGG